MASLQTLIIASLASAVVGGLASGFTVSMLGSDGPASRQVGQEPETKIKAAPRKDSDVTRLEVRIAELEGTLAALRRQQNARTKLKKYAESLAEGEEVPQDGKKRPAAGVIDGEDPVFELAVRSVMDRVDWERDEERKVVRAQRRNERAERQTALLTERLGLDDQQAGAVAAALVKQMDRFRALRDRNDDSQGRPATRSEWREKIAEIRRQTEDELLTVLSEEQMKEYRTVAEEEGIGARGFGRGRRGGDGERSRDSNTRQQQ